MIIFGPIPTHGGQSIESPFIPLIIGVVALVYAWVRYIQRDETTTPKPSIIAMVWITIVAASFVVIGVIGLLKHSGTQ